MAKKHVNRDYHDRPIIPLNVNEKQGDTLQRLVEANDGNVVAALRAWSLELATAAGGLDVLAGLIEDSGESPYGHGGAGCAEIGGVSKNLAVEALEKAGAVVPALTWVGS